MSPKNIKYLIIRKMKLRNLLLSAVAVLLTACSSGQTGNKSVIVYYSQTGTTAKVAEQFIANLNADVIELKCEVPYPDDYMATIEESRDECKNSTGRALANGKLDLAQYDTIYLGFPIWYGTYAPPIVTFAKENELAGKNVVLFCTYGSGGRLAGERNFKEMCPETNVLGSFGIAARQIDNAADEVKAFIENMKNPSQQKLGAFSESRELTEEDMEVFTKATADYAYLGLTAVSVSTQVVAGLNYLFTCTSNGPDGQQSSCQVLIFKPLQGDPVLKSVER